MTQQMVGYHLVRTSQVTASEPTQSDGTALVAGDVWLDSDETEAFPCIYKYSGSAWVKVDGTDQVTSEGIVYADFRQSSVSSLDADALQTSHSQESLDPNKRAQVVMLKNIKLTTRRNKRW